MRNKLAWLVCAIALTACSPDDEGEESNGDAGSTPVNEGGTPANADAGSLVDATTMQGMDASVVASDAGPDATPSVTRPFQGNGISGNVAGSVVTYTNVMVLPNNSGDGRVMMEGVSSSFLSKWRLFVPATPGTYECDDEGNGTVLQLISGASSSAVGSGAGSCSVTVAVAANGNYQGTFVANLLSGSGLFQDVTDGYFNYEKYGPATGGTGLAAGQQGASFEIDGERYTYTLASPLVFESYAGIAVRPMPLNSPGAPLGLQIHSVPNAVGAYRCGEGAAYRAMNIWFYWKDAYYRAGARQSPDPSGPAGSSCEVNVSTVGTIEGFNYDGTFEGTFSGKFVKDDGSASVTVSNGSFRVIM